MQTIVQVRLSWPSVLPFLTLNATWVLRVQTDITASSKCKCRKKLPEQPQFISILNICFTMIQGHKAINHQRRSKSCVSNWPKVRFIWFILKFIYKVDSLILNKYHITTSSRNINNPSMLPPLPKKLIRKLPHLTLFQPAKRLGLGKGNSWGAEFRTPSSLQAESCRTQTEAPQEPRRQQGQ